MARPRSAFPTPAKRQRGQSWQVFWWADGSAYGVALGKVTEAEAERRRMQLALALRGDPWPDWAVDAPAVRRFLRARRSPAGDILAEYARHLLSEVGRSWALSVRGYLSELGEVAGKPMDEVTAADAQAFLDHVLQTPGVRHPNSKPRSVATRNRALAACSRFYRWAVQTGRLVRNPFAGIRLRKESHPESIVYLTRGERDGVLEAAVGDPDGVAVWIALLAGLRRGEVARSCWDDVDLERGRLAVPKTKTGRRRVVPLARGLWDRLGEVKGRGGALVDWPDGEEQWRYRARALIGRLHVVCPDIPRERVRWNAFRHTFGSLLAQAGVSLDKISAWMGNSPEICRRHYAEFVPRDYRDDEIDLI